MAKKTKELELGVKNVLKCEAPATYEAGSPALSDVEKLGSYVVNEANGEILSEKPTCMHPIPRVGTPRGAQEVGEPKIVLLSKPSDLKRRVLALLPQAESIHDLYGEPENTDEDFNKFCNDDSDEVEEFNHSMSLSPYAVDEYGMASYENAIAKEKEKAKTLEHHMAMMQTPFFQEFSKLPEEQRNALLAQAKETLSKSNQSEPPANAGE